MKICLVCGSITDGEEGYCPYCKNEGLRLVTSLKIKLGEFYGSCEYSKEERNFSFKQLFLKSLIGAEVINYHKKE